MLVFHVTGTFINRTLWQSLATSPTPMPQQRQNNKARDTLHPRATKHVDQLFEAIPALGLLPRPNGPNRSGRFVL